jgi:AAA ATPase-like protein/OLD-like protein
MILVSAVVGPFKSINEAQVVVPDEQVTVLVGMNEAGKTVFLQALQKSNDALGIAKFDPVEDYPRKDLPTYLRKHKTEPDTATKLTYRLTDKEVQKLNATFHTNVAPGFEFSVLHQYSNGSRVDIAIDEAPALNHLLVNSQLSTDAKAALEQAESLRSFPDALKSVSLTADDKSFLTAIETRISETNWTSVVQWEAWKWLEKRIPKFLYFGEYELLPSKMNLTDLAARAQDAKTDSKRLQPDHRAVLALLRMADIPVGDFTSPGGYETLKAKIEGISINLTDQIMAFWKQNEDLEVEVDIKTDSEDIAPFNTGPNLYLRIKNRRHRGVSTPFRQRSRGFIWFFSFLVWFDNVQHQLEAEGRTPSDLILLLDEPGLSLHALAQSDFLRYIDDLSTRHQVLYTTHSPFMVHSDRLHQVRMVEDREKVGTVISDNLSGSDARTIFPLQAALGWTIAQNLFISQRNLLVEGPSELIYLKALSQRLEAEGRDGMRDDITIVPTGGLDKVVTFIALLGANQLQLAVLHDYRGAPEQRLMDVVREKMISPKAVLNASQFRDLSNVGVSGRAADIEDLFEEQEYLDLFNDTYAKQLNGALLITADLPPGDRIVNRIEQRLAAIGTSVRPSGGFNHYLVASHFVSQPPPKLGPNTLRRFEALFQAVNVLFK